MKHEPLPGATTALAEPSDEPVVELRDVQFAWPGRDGFSMEIEEFVLKRGERLLLLGPSGGGKSTLLSLLAGIVIAQAGSIKALGSDIGKLGNADRDRFRAEHFGIIFQMFNLLPYGAIIDNVLLPLSFAPKRCQRTVERGGPRAEAGRLLGALGLEESLFTRAAAELSVGQQQRVAAARALIGAPEILIADEPTSALDRQHQERFLDLLFAQLADAGSSLIMVSHDESLAARFDRVCPLHETVKSQRSESQSSSSSEALS